MKGDIRCVDKKVAFEMAQQFFGNDKFTYHDEGELFDVYVFTYEDAELVIEKFYNVKWSVYPFGKFSVKDVAAGYVEFVEGKPSKTYIQEL